jgi:thiaminase/transcriptional activator TenA
VSVGSRGGPSNAPAARPTPSTSGGSTPTAGSDFGAAVEGVLALTNRVGRDLTDGERERVAGHFVTTTRYEWMFWDMGYRQERWSV